jgi:hypothetical protein
MRRIVKLNHYDKESKWIEMELGFQDCIRPNELKKLRPMVIWHKDSNGFTDTICIDIDKPVEKVAENLDITHVKALIESSSGNAHVIAHVSGLTEQNFKIAYEQIGKNIDSNFDKSCNDLNRGFFLGNKIVFQNNESIPIDASLIKPKMKINQSITSTIINDHNNLVSNDTLKKHENSLIKTDNKNPYQNIQGQRMNWLVYELAALCRKQNNTDNLESFAYENSTLSKKEIDSLIAWFRKKFKPFIWHDKTKNPNSGRKSYYAWYKTLRSWGKCHFIALAGSIGTIYSIATSKRYMARYNKEQGKKIAGGKRVGAGRKPKINSSIIKEDKMERAKFVKEKKRQEIIKKFKEKERYDEDSDTLFFDESVSQSVRTFHNKLGFKVCVMNKKPRGLSVKPRINL